MWSSAQVHSAWTLLEGLSGHWAAATRVALRWCAAHTGMPVVVVAAIGLVISLRLARRWARFAVEVALALGALLFAARLGWVRW
jgi:hypothetical protein